MSQPNFDFEKKLWEKGYLVIGIDEVGRGALAGPLVVAGVCFNFVRKDKKRFLSMIENLGINDSKKLSAKKREQLAKIIKKKCLAWAATTVSSRFINRHRLSKAFQKGVREVLKKLKITNGNRRAYLLIDGFYVKYLRGIGLERQKAIIRGDEKSLSIASASIIAKVFRDKLMTQLAKKHPQYDWEKNKGYGTKDHIQALKNYGKTNLHRDLFLRKIVIKT